MSGFRTNVCDTDNHVIGIMTYQHIVVQSRDGFAFTDELLGEGVTYETAKILQGVRCTYHVGDIMGKIKLFLLHF